MFLATVTMLFAAFTSAYIVRRAGTDWRPVLLPQVLWLNTALLVVSSVILELGRRAADRARWQAARAGFVVAMLLGLGFLVGQWAGWRELVAQGVYVPTSPHSSFFYMLTGVHALHLCAGLLVLLVGAVRLSPARSHRGVGATGGYIRLATTFWHFFGVLWVYLFALLAWF
jgi:cytochrome c oxidase subunit 3